MGPTWFLLLTDPVVINTQNTTFVFGKVRELVREGFVINGTTQSSFIGYIYIPIL